jgi:type III secretion system FlhB-like substrate exporter
MHMPGRRHDSGWRTRGKGADRQVFPVSGRSKEGDWAPGAGQPTKPAEYKNVPASQFADRANLKYPIDKPHIHAALAYWSKPENRKFYTKEDRDEITARIVEAALKDGVEVTYNPDFMASLPASTKSRLEGDPVDPPADPPKKEAVSYEQAQALNAYRSPHAIAVDNALQASKQYPQGADNYSPWVPRKNTTDIQGIDSMHVRITGQKPPPEAKIVQEPPVPVSQGEGHPFLLTGDPEAVRTFQPIVDHYFPDLKNHPMSARQIQIVRQDRPNVAGWYEATAVKQADGTYRILPVKIAIAHGQGHADLVETMVHEATHFRRHVQEDAKLRKLINDSDSEEKETVHESTLREGGEIVASTSHPGYYYYVKMPYPQVRRQDRSTLGAKGEAGITSTPEIEDMVTSNQGKTELNKVMIAQPRRLGKASGRVKGKGVFSLLPNPENIDTYFITSEGDMFQFYSPKGTANPKVLAKFIDRADGKVHEERVYEYQDGKLVRIPT